MATFDKAICVSNIYFLAKQKEMKIGDLESECGVSTGYISRLNKEDSKTVPGLEFLLAVAEKLGVSLKSLVSFKFSELTPNEVKVKRFIEKLTFQTQSFAIHWEQENDEDIRNVAEVGCDEYATHPLMIVYYSDKDEYTHVRFNSYFHKGSIVDVVDLYYVDLDASTRIYLAITIYGPEENDSSLELYMRSNHTINPLCFIDKRHNLFFETMKTLHSAVADSASHIHLSSTTEFTIDMYLGDITDIPF